MIVQSPTAAAAPETAYSLGKALLSGPLGGVIGGLVSYFLLDVWLRARRARHALAGALAAEILDNAEDMRAILNDPDRSAIPLSFQPRFTIYRAVASRLGELDFADVQRVVTCYVVLEKMQPLPTVYEQRVEEMRTQLPRRGEPSTTTEDTKKWAGRAIRTFYGSLDNHERICRETATYLRDKYSVASWWKVRRWFRRAPALPSLSVTAPTNRGGTQ